MSKQLTGRNVRVRQDGTWHYRFNFQGKEYSGPTGLAAGVSNRSEAEAFADRRRAELARLGPRTAPAKPLVLGAAIPFREAAEAFLAWCRNSEYKTKPNTADRLRVSFVSLIDFFGAVPLHLIAAQGVEAYKENRRDVDGVREITLRHDLHALSVFYRKFAVKRGMAQVNPVESVAIPSDREAVREHVLTPEEEARYFAAAAALHAEHRKSFKDAQPNLADLARLMLDQGMRPEEALALRPDHFHPATGTLLIAGGKSRAARRTLHLTAASRAILVRRARLGGDWLFPSDRHPGRHLTKLTSTHDRVCREAGVSFVLYDLRHTFATRAIEAGVPVAHVAAILGHSGLRTIHRYVHPSADAQKAGMALYEAAQLRRKESA